MYAKLRFGGIFQFSTTKHCSVWNTQSLQMNHILSWKWKFKFSKASYELHKIAIKINSSSFLKRQKYHNRHFSDFSLNFIFKKTLELTEKKTANESTNYSFFHIHICGRAIEGTLKVYIYFGRRLGSLVS